MCQCAPVPDSYIGTVSSSMFAGMMIGAVGWGTCKSISIPANQIIQFILLQRFRSHRTKCSLQRNPLFHCPLWSPGILHKIIFYSLHCTFLLGKFSWGREFRTVAILIVNLLSVGLNANRWHPFTRAYAERKAVPCNCPFRFFLIWRSIVSSRCPSCRPATFLSLLRSSSL